MTLFQRRLFVALDEWLGILLCLYLWRMGDPLFWWVFPVFVVMVYIISYPFLWWYEYKANRSETSSENQP